MKIIEFLKKVQISLQFVPRSPMDNKPILGQVMACRLFGTKPLLKPMLIQSTNAYMRQWGRWVKDGSAKQICKYCVNRLDQAAPWRFLLHIRTCVCRNWYNPIIRNATFSIFHQICTNNCFLLCLPWWRHQMETFSALLAICVGNSPVTSEFPAQGPVMRSFGVFFDLRLDNGCVNNGDAGDLRHHRAHYDVTVMSTSAYENWPWSALSQVAVSNH